MRMKGLEPPRPETLDPKSNAATNYATCAVIGCKVSDFFMAVQKYLFFSYEDEKMMVEAEKVAQVKNNS